MRWRLEAGPLGLVLFSVALCLLSGSLRSEEPILVTLDEPSPFEPAFGEVDVLAVVSSEVEVERAVFYLDGIVVHEVAEPPYRARVDVENPGAHRFEVIVYGKDGSLGSSSVETPALRVDDEVAVTLQQLYVTATRGGEPVLDLEPQDFAIIEEGERQELATFARGDIPFSAVVLVDASVSMRGSKLRAALGGAEAFCLGMRPLDEAKLMIFSDRILHASPFTTFSQILTAGLERVRATGGTALADHLYLALKQLEQRQGRRVVILLSDGVDSHSVLGMAEVLATARRSQAQIYWLQVPYSEDAPEAPLPAITTAWRSSEDYREQLELLEETILESGGRARRLASLEDAPDAFREILRELREQYALGYFPRAARHDGHWRRVRVRVRDSSIDLRSRGGYIDM